MKKEHKDHAKQCRTWKGGECTCITNPFLTREYIEELKRKGIYNKLPFKKGNKLSKYGIT